MFVAEDFVFLHLPKTGGTFVTNRLRDIYQGHGIPVPTIECAFTGEPLVATATRPAELRHPTETDSHPNQHGAAWQVPGAFRALPLVGCVRNPYDHVVSMFEFRWWANTARYSAIELSEIRASYPYFPDLTFPEFIDASHEFLCPPAWRRVPSEVRPGRATREFLRVYQARHVPDEELSNPALRRSDWRDLLAPVRYLFNERLNDDLAALLSDYGFAFEDILLARDSARINPREGGRDDSQRDWRPYYDGETRAKVRLREHLLFELFPDYDG